MKIKPGVQLKAYAFNLRDVKLLDGSPFKNAMDKDASYVLLLEPDRLLHRFYLNAGLPVKAPVYGGWESDGLSGHTLGHYLSACAMLYVSTGDKRFKDKLDYVVAELKRCQDARKSGYVGAIPNEDSIFGKVARGEIKSGGFDLNGGWSPWYTVHKVMAGLADAYLYADNQESLSILKKMADWAIALVSKLDEQQMQKMLRCEYGGMNDLLANLYAITGEKKYLDLSYRFFDDFVMLPLSKKKDPMPGKHSNTNVPKAIGSAAQYELTGNVRDSTIASFFWQTMTKNHSYVIGGNSNYEYCGEPGKLNDRLSDNTCETCNTYNMLKLTRHLFAWNPVSAYGDYYERALYNHILASQNPESGMMTYFVPLRMGTKKAFSDSFNTFTCCVGSGIENHSKYGEGIYYEGNDNSIYVNLFIGSRLDWKSKKITITQETMFPTESFTTLRVNTTTPQRFKMRIRKPQWSRLVIASINGIKNFQPVTDENGFMIIDREWKDGDKLTVNFSQELYTESMPDNPDRIAFLYGPLVLAGQLGDSLPDPVYGVPVLLTNDRNAANWIEKTGELTFRTKRTGTPFDITLKPFYATYRQYYSVYWDFFTPDKWEARKTAYEDEKRKQQEIEQKTIDHFRVGEMQPERDHNLVAGEKSYVSDALGVNGREARAGSHFSFDMKVDSSGAPVSILFLYIGDDRGREFDIFIDGIKLVTEKWDGGETGKFYNKIYPLPVELTKGRKLVKVRIEANQGRTAGRIFGVRTLR